MKTILIKLIKLYQQLPLKSHYHCRFIPTCSSYAIYVINNYGVIKGTILSIKRILKCNFMFKGGIDLPKEKRS